MVIDVAMEVTAIKKAPADGLVNLPGLESCVDLRSLLQIEFFGSTNGRSPAIHSQLAINIFRVRAHRV